MNLSIESIKGLFSSKNKERSDGMVMDKKLATAYNATRQSSLHSSFCYAPSTNMYFSQNGDVKVCCHNTEFTIGTYPKQSIQEIWTSPKAEELRKYMRQYDLAHGCSICEFDMKLGSFEEVRAKHFDEFSRKTKYPVMMEFLLSNTCNLECVMCKGEYSSLIRKNREKLPPLQNPYDRTFVKQLEEFIPHLTEARFSGSGEAFSIDINYEIWDMLIRLNPTCKIMVQTNGTILTERVKNILHRGNFQIGVSVDSLVKKTYEGIRVNANFDKVMENVKWFSDYCKTKNSYFMLALCVMRQNWRELPAFIAYCNELGAAAVLHKVWHPKQFAIDNLPATELQDIYRHLHSAVLAGATPLERQNKRHYEYFVSVVKNWMEQPAAPATNNLTIDALAASELLPYLEASYKKYLDDEYGTEEEKTVALSQFTNKFAQFLALFPDDPTREMVTRHACHVPANVMAESFKKYPVEYLFAEAGNLLKA